MEYIELALKFINTNQSSILPALALIGQVILWREMKIWKKELLSLKLQVLDLVRIHCGKFPADQQVLLIDPAVKQIEELERMLSK